MATSKPRVTVTLEPDDYALLRELAELSDESMSSILADLLATTAPQLRRVVAAGRLFKGAQASVRDEIRGKLSEAEQSIEPALTAGMGHLHTAMSDFDALLKSIENGTENPRPVTRGSRPSGESPSKSPKRGS